MVSCEGVGVSKILWAVLYHSVSQLLLESIIRFAHAENIQVKCPKANSKTGKMFSYQKSVFFIDQSLTR